MIVSCPGCHTQVSVSIETLHHGEVRCESCGYDLSNEVRHVQELDDTAQAPEMPNFSSIRSGTLIDQYSVLRPVGRGTFGSVYLAYDTALHRRVALKFPRLESGEPQINELFIREAQSAAQVRHPNIVPVFGIGTFRDRPYIATEYIDGPSLRDWLKDNSLDSRQAVELCATLAGALHAAHTQGVIHRDLKPGNILMSGQTEPFIVDFGLAKLRMQLAESPEDRGRIIGTLSYMSPEQAKGDGHRADARSDIYSLGVILYELLTGQSPYPHERELMEEVCEGDVQPIKALRPDLPDALCQLTMQALRKSPTERPRTAEDFGNDLSSSLGLLPKPAVTQATPRRFVFALLAVAALMMLATATYLGIRSWARPVEIRADKRNGDEKGREPRVPTVVEPNKSTLHAHVLSSQPGASVSIVSVTDPNFCLFELEPIARVESTPGSVELGPGWYLAEVRFPSGAYQSFLRRIPVSEKEIGKPEYPHVEWQKDLTREGWIQWEAFAQVSAGKFGIPRSKVTGGRFLTWRSDPDVEKQRELSIPDYFISSTEITNRLYVLVTGELPKDSPYSLPLAEELLDQPVTHVRWDEAVEFAELVGGRLPAVEEFDYVFENLGTTDFPSGNLPPQQDAWQLTKVGEIQSDVTQADGISPPLQGLASNCFEWTLSHPRMLDGAGSPMMLEPGLRVELQDNVRLVRGGPDVCLDDPSAKMPTDASKWRGYGHPKNASHPMIGFRVVWQIEPLFD